MTLLYFLFNKFAKKLNTIYICVRKECYPTLNPGIIAMKIWIASFQQILGLFVFLVKLFKVCSCAPFTFSTIIN